MLVHQLGSHAGMQPVMLNKVGLHFTRCLKKIFIVISVPTSVLHTKILTTCRQEQCCLMIQVHENENSFQYVIRRTHM